MPGKGFKDEPTQQKAQHTRMTKRTQKKRAQEPPEFILPPYEMLPTIPQGVAQGKFPDISNQPTLQIGSVSPVPPASGGTPPAPPKRMLRADETIPPVAVQIPNPPPIVRPANRAPNIPLPGPGTPIPPPPPAESLATQQVPTIKPSEQPLVGITRGELELSPVGNEQPREIPEPPEQLTEYQKRSLELQKKSISSAIPGPPGPPIAMLLVVGELLIFANALVSGQMASMLNKLWQTPSSGTQSVASDTSARPILLEFLGLQLFLLVLVLLARLNRGMYAFSMTFLLGVWAVWLLFVLPEAIKSNSWNNTINALFPGTGITPKPGPIPVSGTPQQRTNQWIQKNYGGGRMDTIATKYESGYYTTNGRYS